MSISKTSQRPWRFGLLLAGGSLVFTSCSGSNVGSAIENRVSAVTDPTLTTLAVRPGVDTPVSIQLARGDSCVLANSDSGDTDESSRFDTNSQGTLRFTIEPNDNAAANTILTLNCVDSARIPFEHRVQLQITDSAPLPVKSASPPPGSRIRPALGGDPDLPSVEQLRHLGYPPRPDKIAAPQAYAKWLKFVSNPAYGVDSILVPDTINNVNPASKFWSGGEAASPSPAYTDAWMEFFVPFISVAETTKDFCSTWVGLDGDGTNDIIQSGTESIAQSVSGVTVRSYYAWIEYFPQSEIKLPDISVDGADDVGIYVYACDSNQNSNVNGGFGCFWFNNYTQSTWSFNVLAIPTGAQAFSGASAEYIIERPLLGGSSIAHLSDYSTETLFNRGQSGGSSSLTMVTMYNASFTTILSSCALSGGNIHCTWHGFN